MSLSETLNLQSELEARRLGMRSLDPAEIARHFGRAAELRAAIAKDRLRLVCGARGTKGSCPPKPQ